MTGEDEKQLIIDSDEAYRIAHDLAERLGATVAEVVLRALREFDAGRRIPSRRVTPEET